MGKRIHRLTKINAKRKSATCEACGGFPRRLAVIFRAVALLGCRQNQTTTGQPESEVLRITPEGDFEAQSEIEA
jgi:hypothetical protein